MFFGPGLGQLKCETQDSIDAAPGEYGLLSNDFVLGAIVNAPADRGVFAFIIFANDQKIDVTSFTVSQRRFYPWHEPYRSQVCVLLKMSANRDQEPPKRNMIRNGRKADCSQENRIVVPELMQTVLGHHSSGLLIELAAPRKLIPLQTKTVFSGRRLQHTDPFGNN